VDQATGAIASRNAIFVIRPDQMRVSRRVWGGDAQIPAYYIRPLGTTVKDILKAQLTEHVRCSRYPGTACA
jgi:hypothetical protein